MMRFRALSRAYPFFGHVRSGCIVLAGSAVAFAKIDAEKIATNISPGAAVAHEWLQLHIWWLGPALLATGALVAWSRRLIGDPARWKIVHDVLDHYQDSIFGEGNDELSEHRVTLFKHLPFHFVARRWPGSGWLVPVERSGTLTQRSSTCFKAPDDPSLLEGVAGAAWNRRKPLDVQELPDISGACTDAERDEYLKRTRTPPWMAKKRNLAARSYYAMHLEVAGKPWGVIVIDSRNAKLDLLKVQAQQRLVLRFLGKTLETL